MARISLTPRRRFGKVKVPALVLGHNPQVMRVVRFRGETEQVEPAGAVLEVPRQTGGGGEGECAWCMDFGYWMSDRHGLDAEKISKVPDWREYRETYTEVEQFVMEYAEAMSETPQVTDEPVEPLIGHLGEPAFVELTVMVAVENMRTRVNAAVGLPSQGFSEACRVPLTTADTSATGPARPDGGPVTDAAL